MCGRLVVVDSAEVAAELRLLYDASPFDAQYNVKPTQRVPLVREPGKLEVARWDLVPAWWKKSMKEKPIAFNARIETVTTKPFFRHLVGKKRCLVVNSGFYEWKTNGKAKTPFFIRPKDGRKAQTFAGLWDVSHDPTTGEVLESCTIITGAAAGMMTEFHQRTPLLVPPEKRAMWLDPTVDAATALAALSSEESADAWSAFEVAPIKMDSEGPSMILPFSAERAAPTPKGAAQGSLF